MQQQKEKVRFFALARELNMESKDLLALYQEHGLGIRSQLSTVEPDTQEQIRKLVDKPLRKLPPPAPSAALPPAAPVKDPATLGTRPTPPAASAAPPPPTIRDLIAPRPVTNDPEARQVALM